MRTATGPISTILAIGLAAACSSPGIVTPVTVVGYTVTIKTAAPASAQVGSSLLITFTVTENKSDSSSAPASGKTFTVAITAGGGTVNAGSSATLTTATDGSVSLTWALGALAGTQTIRGSVSSDHFLDVGVIATAGPAARLALKTQPSPGALSGLVFTLQPTVQLEDAAGNAALGVTVPVTASIATGGGTIGGAVTVNSDSTGLATFANLSLSGVAGAVTLKFVATLGGQTASVTSTAINVVIPWATRASMPTVRWGLATGVVNGALYAVGGYSDHTLGTVDAYDPATDFWTREAFMPTRRAGLSIGVVNGILYAVGGGDSTGVVGTVEAYDPATNSWTTKTSMPTLREYFSVGVVNGILYAVGGYNSGALGTFAAYNAVTNSWTTRGETLTPRSNLAVGVVNGVLYAVGGFNGSAMGTVESLAP